MKEIKARAKAVHEGRHAHLGMQSTSAHPGKNCASGGAAHSDAAEDRSMVKSMIKPFALNRAHGGRTHKGKSKGKGHTKINIVVGQPGGGGQQPVPVPVPVGGPAGGMPPGGPMGAMPPRPMPGPGGPGMAGVGALGGTAGLPRKKGGMVHLTGGAGGGRGRLQKNHLR